MTNQEAIESLKGQIKCLKCEKGIDCEKCRPNWSIENDIEALNKGIEALENQKTGHWIDTDEWRETVDGFEQWGYFRKCSRCGYVFKFLEIDNYCPNCGAKMEGE